MDRCYKAYSFNISFNLCNYFYKLVYSNGIRYKIIENIIYSK